ncbi:hypothetical protein [Vibrio cholerae]|uniref:hypothetical protein n=1 Tax=Vibrio cholerae TaxID=666 RepID=UPI001E14A172|nr:hypothetical protein [Vibrio cholerae]EGQ8592425.1 hypothetical protein [Vibrio cholerae]EGQ8661834.1 hypothetical protein [Vibrio cholerae]MCU4228250.1 hypothetical protein [Vibrio cholerae]MEB5553833.1 hypothetical protein [Vibrio cholerae]
MGYSKKPKPIDFSAMSTQLKKLGIDSDISHLSDAQAPTSQTSQLSPNDTLQMQGETPTVSDWSNSVFGTFLSIYESTWVHSYGRRPSAQFITFADRISEQELMRIIQHCRERLLAGDKWPPIMGELVILKDILTETELEDAISRVMERNPIDDIEKWLMQNKSYELRRLPENQFKKQFREYYRHAMKLKERGKLNPKPIGIATHSVKSLVDIKRDEYEEKYGTSLHPRIQAILDSKNQ